MASVMPPQGLAPSVSFTRQDIISELLDGYTYDASDEISPSTPVSAFKGLPPSPPQASSQKDRKQEAIERMNTQFQLRELDNAAAPNVARKDSLEQSPKRIVSRSLSRSGTPPSLNLIVSNGSTAALPPTPVIYAPVKSVPSSLPRAAKDLPPQLPPRSSRREIAEGPVMGQHESKGDLERNDSFHSYKDTSPVEAKADTKNVAPVIPRKALPGVGVRKFVSLLELNNGPRGGNKVKPPTSAPRNLNVQQDINGGRASNNQLPPTPPEEKSIVSPPRKALVGLPSNPRAKSPMSPLHVRGKSSTGFFLKAHRPAPPPPTAANTNVTVTTPEMTPSPTLKPEVRRDHDISPVTPLPPPTEQNRPFSYEAPAPEAQTQPEPAPLPQTTPVPQSQAPPAAQAQVVPDVQIHAAPEVQEAVPELKTPTASTPAVQKAEPPAEVTQDQSPAPTTASPTSAPASTSPFTSPPTSAAHDDDLAPFMPLTHQPHTHTPALIPRITSAHLSCYTSHATSVWSNNRFQSLGCMVCASNAPDRKWTCAWCCLRVCIVCSDKLVRVPGRRLDVLLQERDGGEERGAGAEAQEYADADAHVGVDVDVGTDADGYSALIHADDARDRALRMSSISEEEVHERGRAVERQLRAE